MSRKRTFGSWSYNMTADEIREACACSPTLAKAVKAFRAMYPRKPIFDLNEVAHMFVNAEEAMIESEGRLYRYLDGKIERYR